MKSVEINLVYFGIFLLLVLAMTLSHFYFWGDPLIGLPLFFFVQAFGQALLEAGFFVLIGCALKQWAPRWLFHAFIGFSFAFLLIHFADFTIIRLMDAGISYAIHHFFHASPAHIVTAFQAMNVNSAFLGATAAAICLVPLVGIALYRLTQPLSRWMALKISSGKVILFLAAIAASLFALDLFYRPQMDREEYDKYHKALPLGTTFFPPEKDLRQIPAPIASFRSEDKIQNILEKKNFRASSKPNIYLFIIETLRRDFTIPSIAPHIAQFGEENISFAESYANANSTHPSWFSIFHSDYPYHWTSMRDSWKEGSVPLQILKKLGYRIRIYSSADLRYFGMDELLFGQGRKLAEKIEEFTERRELEPCERDALCLASFQRDLEEADSSEGNIFLFFLDSTHSEYSVPKDFPLQFQPIAKEIDYLTVNPKEIEPIKNRYRNAICYVDQLVGSFLENLKKKNLYSDAIIAITGDHGEEFFEEGSLFHGTHLNRYQTAVPLYYKFKENPWVPLDEISTHLDIFPSILHFITGRSDLSDLLDGQSLFSPHRRPFRIAVLQNGPDTPREFSLEGKRGAVHCRFANSQDIYRSTQLEILPSSNPELFNEATSLITLHQTKE